MSERLRTTSGESPGTFGFRLGVVVAVSLVAVVLLVTLVMVALGPRDDPSAAFGWVYQGMLVVAMAVALPPMWRWALAARPRESVPVLPVDEDPASGPHDGLSGNAPLPRRW